MGIWLTLYRKFSGFAVVSELAYAFIAAHRPAFHRLSLLLWGRNFAPQKSMAAVSALGGTVWVLMRRLNSSCNRSMALVVLIDFHWSLGKRTKGNKRSPALFRPGRTGCDDSQV
jgi:hypothetical protein